MSDGLSHAGGEQGLVVLDPDHPGFRDAAYRARRNHIARLALEYVPGSPVPRVDYIPEEHAVWRAIWRSLDPLHERYACREYLDCSAALQLSRDEIPQLADVDAATARTTGFRMLPVAGLVAPRTFLSYLGRDVFLSTQYIRHHSRPLYTPEPDCVHELVGHAATLVHPDFVRLNRAFGVAAARVSEEALRELESVYWYTLEFGLVREGSDLKVYGAGLLSSFGELERLESHAALVPFDLETIARAAYDPTDYQPRLFVAPSFNEMTDRVVAWLECLS